MSGNRIKLEDLDRVLKLLELLQGELEDNDEQEGWVTQKKLVIEDDVKALLPSVRNTSCWLGQAMSFCSISKKRTRSGIRYNLDIDTITKAQERIRSLLNERDHQAIGGQGADVDVNVGG